MNCFKHLFDTLKTNFEIEGEIEVNQDFVSNFHKEFTKYEENIEKCDMGFLDEMEEVKTQSEEGEEKVEMKPKFEQLTMVSQWFKDNKEHPKYQENMYNLYAMLCVSQDMLGREVLKGISDLKFDSENFDDSLKKLLEDESFNKMFKGTPLESFLDPEKIKPMIDNFMNKIKELGLEELLKDFQEGNLDEEKIKNAVSTLMSKFLGGSNGNGPDLSGLMSMAGDLGLGNLLGASADGLTPQQKAKLRREKAKADYRRKVREREKAKKKKRNGNRRNRNKK